MPEHLIHPAESLSALLERIDAGGASRYVNGAVLDSSWGLWRWCNSRFATFLARPLVTVADSLSGFFAVRRDVFERASGLELMVKGTPARIEEVPITFRTRLNGRSTLSMRQRVEYLEHVARLYAHRYSLRRRGNERLAAGFTWRR